MDESYRKLTKAEREELASIVAVSTQIGRAVLFVLAVIFLAGVFRILQTLLPIDAPAWIVPTALLAWLLYRRSGRWTGGREFRRKVAADLADGNARILKLEAVEAIEFEEHEDEGPTYAIRTADEQWVMFSGQDMLSHKRRGFPWTEFGVAEAPHSGLFFGLEKNGDPVPVARTLPPLAYETARDIGTFARTAVVLDKPGSVLLEAALRQD